MIDLNKFDIEVARREGKKVQVNIGQIKEVRKIVLNLLAEHSNNQVLELMEIIRHHKRRDYGNNT